MREHEYILTCLAEECAEVAQRVSKALRFGLSEVQPGQALSNAERITEELKDLCAVAAVARSNGLIPQFYPTPVEVLSKSAKIEKFKAISRREGTLDG